MYNRKLHFEIIKDFLIYLNKVSKDYILKGGTSLMMCYGLDRFSEDIDLDGFNKNFFTIVDNFIRVYGAKYPNISYRKAKDTDTVKRAFVHYNNDKPLKIEVSYRRKDMRTCLCGFVNGILVYDIKEIMAMKINAFTNRDKIRDLYDVVFIYTRYKNALSSDIIMSLRNIVAYKGIEQFDYLMKDQKDDLINNNKLAENFLNMYYDLGLVWKEKISNDL